MNIDPRNHQSDRLVFHPTVHVIAVMALTTKFHERVDENTNGIERIDQDRGTDAERLVEFAGRKCYDSGGKGRSSQAYHEHIIESGHGSVLEHSSITFEISGVSRGFTHEFVRHRVGVAISQRSTRYVDESNCRLIVPPAFVIQPGDSDEVANLKRIQQEVLLKGHQDSTANYTFLVHGSQQLGLDRKTARGAARATLGNGIETSLVWTCNLRALLNVLRQRGSEAADAEIRRLAIELYRAALPHAPAILGECVELFTAVGGVRALKVRAP